MSEFEKTCTYCSNKIKLSDTTGKWLPYNLDNSPHDCRNEANAKAIKVAKEEANKMWNDMIKRLQSVIAELEELKST